MRSEADYRISLFTFRFPKSLSILALFHFGLSVLFIVVYCIFFNRGNRILFLHPILAIGLLAAIITCLCAITVLVNQSNQWLARLLTALLLTAYTTALLLLYAIDITSNLLWDNNVHYALAIQYVAHLHHYAKIVFGGAWWLLFVLLAFPISVFALHFKFSALILKDTARLIKTLSKPRLFTNFTLILSGCALLYGGSLVAILHTPNRRMLIGRDPFLGLVKSAMIFPGSPRRDAAVTEDSKIQKQYNTPLSFQKKNIILIIVDALRASHTQVYGYDRVTTPFLAELKNKGRLKIAHQATATCPDSPCGILSTLTSKNADELEQGNFNLIDLLHSQEYRTHLILSGTHSFWYDLKNHYGPHVDFFFDGAQSKQYLPSDDRLIFEALEQVPETNGAPVFFYFHLMSAHDLGIKLPENNRFQPSLEDTAKIPIWNFVKESRDVIKYTNSYDNGVLQADALIKEIFGWLDKKGYLQNSIAVILGDHAQELGERGHLGHSSSIYQEQLGIPVMIYDEPSVQYANLNFATQVDIAPTIIDRLGLKIPESWHGHSLLRPAGEWYNFHELRFGNPRQALTIQIGNKIYKYFSTASGQNEELFELNTDPTEKHNLIAEETEIAQRLRSEWHKRYAPAPMP